MMTTELHTPFELFTPKQVKRLLKDARGKDLKPGWTLRGTTTLRTNSIIWYDEELVKDKAYEYDWADKILCDHRIARKDLPMDWMYKPYQISRYQVGEQYDWHPDWYEGWQKRSSNRSLTLTCTLQSAPGAILETETGSYDLQPGWAVMFPSKELHRATAPTEGERWAFTVWGMAYNKED